VRGLRSRPTSAVRITFQGLLDPQLQASPQSVLVAPTEAGYDKYISAYLLPTLGGMRISDIAPQLIATLFDKLRKDHTRRVVRKVWTLFRSILEDAVDDDIVGKNPMRRVPMPKTRLPNKKVLPTELVLRGP
jgi:hypothetical protein